MQSSGGSIATPAGSCASVLSEQDQHGHLVHRPGGGWAFHYDDETGLSDEVGYHFADERFIVGEYVSINDSGKMHTYRVTSVSYI